MRNGKHVAKRTGSKMLVTALALVLVCCMAVGGTMAWLMDSTDEVVNTFTSSDVDIELKETDAAEKKDAEGNTYFEKNYDMIPGYTYVKDPKVTVFADSEKCWLFVKVETEGSAVVNGENKTFADYISYTVAAGWEVLDADNYPGVYCREVEKSDENQTFSVLAGDQVTINADVTKAMMDALAKDDAVMPEMNFTAYAIQFNESEKDTFTAAEAWEKISTTP